MSAPQRKLCGMAAATSQAPHREARQAAIEPKAHRSIPERPLPCCIALFEVPYSSGSEFVVGFSTANRELLGIHGRWPRLGDALSAAHDVAEQLELPIAIKLLLDRVH